jgi:hypothetical protein
MDNPYIADALQLSENGAELSAIAHAILAIAWELQQAREWRENEEEGRLAAERGMANRDF